ncbi:MAG: nicotinate-nucleotide adenylyltransferase [Deltaproteobacteria bacterium]|nr:nicotinate-nucleotide adenylyltransferase [Deltaproteobacteria bacterium]
MAAAKSGTRKTGIFGGTFDPVHFGHLRPAEEVRQRLALDELCFVPAAVPPHKRGRQVTAAAHRLRMLEAAIDGNPYFRCSTYELEKGGPSYSIDTLEHFRRQGGGELFFIIGWDAFREIETWKAYGELFRLANFVVMSRFLAGRNPGSPRSTEVFPVAIRGDFCYEGEGLFRHLSGSKVFFQPVTRLDISSSLIRRECRAGRSLAYLLPAAVKRYIEVHGLYVSGEE